MHGCILAFLLGVMLTQQLSRLPNAYELAAMGALGLLLVYRRYWPLLALLLGLLWSVGYAEWRLSTRLADVDQDRDLQIQGYIASLPQRQEQLSRFDFVVTEPAQAFPDKVRLSWYSADLPLAAGQAWQFSVKLRPPHGRFNPAGFDYEAWLFANGIGATGTVRNKPAPQAISLGVSAGQYFAHCRQWIADKLDAALPDAEQAGLIKALTIGSQNAVSPSLWQVFRETGTIHLMVISGSHISLIAGLVYLSVRRLWARTGILRLSPQTVAAMWSWLSAVFYAGLAGYSVPTLRAVVMLSVALAALTWQRHVSSLQLLLLALLAVLLFDPLAVLSVGFWLSFVAVGLLIYVSAGRLRRPGYWREAGLAQWATAIGLSPLLIVFFQQVSLISPLANALAVPVIGLLIVPLALVGVVCLLIWPPLATLVLLVGDYLLRSLVWVLTNLADLPFASIVMPQPPWYALLFAVVGGLLVLAPRGFPGQRLGILWFLPMLFVASSAPKPGEFRMTMLDVGQGSSAVIQTATHWLVFDVGAKYSETSDMGESVVLPFLRQQGVKQIDTLVISHDDNDHSGGADALLAEIDVHQLLSSAPTWAERSQGEYCRSGQVWEWDQVRFSVLSPPPSGFASENDNSCVLQVATKEQRLLLTGDIEQAAEDWLLEHYAGRLDSNVLVAAHHGSKSSSTLGFLNQVNPSWVLISAGYQNRFSFPHAQVLARYRQVHAGWLNTAEQGAISLQADPQQWVLSGLRQQNRRYWMAKVPEVADR